MKKTYLIITLLFIAVFAFSQEIPNNSFESWTTASAGHEDPDSWSTANSTTNVFPIYKFTTEKTTDAYDGTYAAKLTSTAILTLVAPGFVTLGDFSMNVFTQVTSITGGLEYNLRPTKLMVWYKYTPSGNDNMRIGMWMLRNDGTSVPDTVGTVLFESPDLVSEYNQLVMDVDYRNDYDPELLNIIAVSSIPNAAVAGSVLLIDKFELEYATGLIAEKSQQLEIYPNPANDYIKLTEYFNNSRYFISDMIGKTILDGFYDKNEKISVADLPVGVYLISIEKNGIIHSQKFIK